MKLSQDNNTLMCYTCRRFERTSFLAPPLFMLKSERRTSIFSSTGSTGVDFVGPLMISYCFCLLGNYCACLYPCTSTRALGSRYIDNQY